MRIHVRPGRRWKAAAVLAVAAAVGAALAASAFASSAERSTAKLTKVTLVAQPNGASLPLFVAKKLGYFKAVGLDATIKYYSIGSAALAGGASGEWQAGWLGAPPALSGAGSFGLIPVGLMIREDRNHIMFMSKKALQGSSPAKVLKGHQIATAENSLADQVMRGCAAKFGVNPGTLKVVNLDPGGIVQALKSGRVPAIDSWATPDFSLLSDPKYVQVCSGAAAGVAVVDPFVITPKFAKENPHAAAAFTAAVYRANEYINTHLPQATQDMLELYKKAGVTGSAQQASYEIIIRNWFSYQEALASMQNGNTAKYLHASADFFVKHGVWPTAPPIDKLLAQGAKVLKAAGAIKPAP